MLDWNPAVHKDYDPMAYPRCAMNHNGRPWADGVLFLHQPEPNVLQGVRADLTVQWQERADLTEVLNYMPYTTQVSPAYAYARAASINRGGQ